MSIYTTNIDQLVRKHAQSHTLDDVIVQWCLHRYRPSLRRDNAEQMLIADAYDARCVELGITARAYRA